MFMLEKFVSVHCNSYVMMTQCAEHADYQLPNSLTHVNFLIGTIVYKDYGLNAAIAIVKVDKGPTRKMNKLEHASAYLTSMGPCS